MFLNSSKGNINLSISLVTFFVCIAIALGVALFHYYYSPTQFFEYKVSDISERLSGVTDFPATAKNMLNSDKSVSYIKLLDRNGVLEESFGNDTLGNTKRFTIDGPNNKSIVLGLKSPENLKIDKYLIVWSLFIGSALSMFLIFIVFMKKPDPRHTMDKLEMAMDRISKGDYSVRIDLGTAPNEDISILNTFQSFNRLAESLNNKYESHIIIDGKSAESGPKTQSENLELSNRTSEEITGKHADEEDKFSAMDEPDAGFEEEEVQNILFKEVNGSAGNPDPHEEEAEFDLSTGVADKQIFDESDKDNVEDDIYEPGDITDETDNPTLLDTTAEEESADEVSSFKPKIVLPQSSVYPKYRNVTVVVAKIDNFENLTQKLNSSELNSFLTQYRKSASQIISSYGGVIEALLQDEIVAIFNAPDEQNNPELRAICASVEVLHELATMAKKRRNEGKEVIAGKIGVGVQSLSYYSETGVPDSVKNVIKNARYVCENANLWKVYVTSNLHELVNENVDSKEYLVDGEVLYSITGVEHGVVERDNIS